MMLQTSNKRSMTEARRMMGGLKNPEGALIGSMISVNGIKSLLTIEVDYRTEV